MIEKVMQENFSNKEHPGFNIFEDEGPTKMFNHVGNSAPACSMAFDRTQVAFDDFSNG